MNSHVSVQFGYGMSRKETDTFRTMVCERFFDALFLSYRHIHEAILTVNKETNNAVVC